MDIKELADRYNYHPYRDDNKMKALDIPDFAALLWTLNNCSFDVTGFSNKGFLRYLLTGDKLALYIINNIDKLKLNFLKLIS